MANRKTKYSWLILLLTLSCLEPYQPPDVGGDINALVVDGYVNLTDKSAVVKLTRTTSLSNAKAAPPEVRATVGIEVIGSSFVTILPETSIGVSGVYANYSATFDPTKKYRLHIRTSKNKNYYSDYVDFKQSPPIDSIYYEVADDGIQVYLATHDVPSGDGFYQWTFEETWHHRSFYDPRFVILNGKTQRRPNGESTLDCWTTQPSSGILIASSENLSQDIINRFPVTFIPKGDPRILLKYSILVRQQSISQPAYTFWEQLKKTTESVGGLFDPLPSQVTGNIHNVVDALEPVMGFFGGGTVTSKRIFIDLKDLPESYDIDLTGTCPLLEIDPAGISQISGPVLIVSDAPIFTSHPRCLDCRIDGGSLTKPDFWP